MDIGDGPEDTVRQRRWNVRGDFLLFVPWNPGRGPRHRHYFNRLPTFRLETGCIPAGRRLGRTQPGLLGGDWNFLHLAGPIGQLHLGLEEEIGVWAGWVLHRRTLTASRFSPGRKYSAKFSISSHNRKALGTRPYRLRQASLPLM